MTQSEALAELRAKLAADFVAEQDMTKAAEIQKAVGEIDAVFAWADKVARNNAVAVK